MKKEIEIIVNGKDYQVAVEDLDSSPLQVTVNGLVYSVELKGEKKPAVIRREVVTTTAKPAPAPVAPAVKSASNPASPTGKGTTVNSPMPGTILDIVKKPGNPIKRGEQVLALEAMKMKNGIKSPVDGVISDIFVSDGQSVAFGAPLFSVE